MPSPLDRVSQIGDMVYFIAKPEEAKYIETNLFMPAVEKHANKSHTLWVRYIADDTTFLYYSVIEFKKISELTFRKDIQEEQIQKWYAKDSSRWEFLLGGEGKEREKDKAILSSLNDNQNKALMQRVYYNRIVIANFARLTTPTLATLLKPQ